MSSPRLSAVLRATGSKSVTVFPLLECNARCSFCGTRVYTEQGILSTEDFFEGNARRAKDYTFTLDQMRDLYRELREEGIESVNIQGGEPTIWPPLPELLRFGHELGFREQTIVSNGRAFADRALAERILVERPKTIVLSIFGADAAVHDEALGVRRAFDDLLAGVRNLLAVLKERPDLATTVTAQFTLYRANHAELPRMLDFWYREGLRTFSLALMRESGNVRAVSSTVDFFFDLAALRGPFDAGLDWGLTHRDATIRFGEILSCLASDDHLASVLADMRTNSKIFVARAQLNKNRFLLVGARSGVESSECDTCDARESCVGIEEHYRRRYSIGARAIRVAERFDAIVQRPLDEVRFRRLRRLLELPEKLEVFGVEPARLLALRARLVRFASSALPETLPELVWESGRFRLAVHLATHAGGGRRFLRQTTFGGVGPFGADPSALLARLAASAPPELRSAVDFLASAQVVASGPLAVAFTYAERSPRRPPRQMLVVLYDDQHCDEDAVLRSLSAE